MGDAQHAWWDASGQLVCGIHGATFRPTDGHCTAGPCAGAALEPLIVEQETPSTVRVFASSALQLPSPASLRLGAAAPRATALLRPDDERSPPDETRTHDADPQHDDP